LPESTATGGTRSAAPSEIEQASRRGALVTALRCSVLAAAYVGAAQLGLALSFSHEHVTAVWPPTGVAVAALLLFGARLWPGVLAGALLANVLDGTGAPVAAAIAVGNTLAPVAAVALLRRAGVRPTLERLRDVLWVTFGAGFAAMTISATFGASVLTLSGAGAFASIWRVWWVGDAMGVVLLAPLLLTLFAQPLRTNRLVVVWRQAAVLLAAFTTVTVLAVVTESAAGYLVIPVALWIALQLEQSGAAAAVVLMSGIDLWKATTSPDAGVPIDQQLMGLQGVNATIALILLCLAVVMSDRRRARDELHAAAEELEDRVRSRTRELEASEERLAQAQRLAHIGSFQWDAATDTNTWSGELMRIYGLSPEHDGPPGFEEYIGFVREDVRGDVQTAVQNTIAAGTSISHEYPVVLRDGTRKWVHAYIEVLRDADGNLSGLRGTCQDVTERRLAEDAQRASDARFRALVRSAPDAVVVVDAGGKIVLLNDQTCNLLGYREDELVGHCMSVLIPEDLRPVHRAHRERYFAKPDVRPMGAGRELSARRKDGSLVPVDVSLSPVETDEGTLVFALLRDASERRNVEDTLRSALEKERRAADDLRKLDEAKSAFLSAVSHELRTPLTAILGFAELMQDETIRSSEMMDDLVDRLQGSATRLAGLLSDLVDVDRLERGILEPHRRRTLLRDLVDRALVAVDGARHDIELHVDDVFVNVDPAQTERIIENLVANAVKYSPPGSHIEVIARAGADGGVEIHVMDDGPGIADELRRSIFEPFVRGDTGTFTPGTGVGLALVDRFAKLHGGRAWVEDREGGGAVFRVELPGAAAEHPAVA
jgi:PAS domain S-box-containing protein